MQKKIAFLGKRLKPRKKTVFPNGVKDVGFYTRILKDEIRQWENRGDGIPYTTITKRDNWWLLLGVVNLFLVIKLLFFAIEGYPRLDGFFAAIALIASIGSFIYYFQSTKRFKVMLVRED